ncbi:hypothetical protein UlMin_023056 [Ulmus minor]
MNGSDYRSGRWKSIKQRLGLKGMGCCGANWSRPTSSTFTILETLPLPLQEQEEEEEDHSTPTATDSEPVGVGPTNVVVGPVPATSSGMNLAMALAAERNSRAGNEGPVKTLMTLIEETDGVDWNKRRKRDNGRGGDWLCCVCMERNKGAAFIPCGHTFCRVCSREIWVNRGSCPLCNRPIAEILDIY